MKSGMKAAIIVAVILVVVGLVIAVGAMALTGFNFEKLSTKEYRTTVLKPSGSFDRIDVNITTADVSFIPSEDGTCTVTCTDDENVEYTAEVKDAVLTVKCRKIRKGADFLSVSAVEAKVTVALPGKTYAALSAETDTGDVLIPADFALGNVKLITDTGDAVCEAAVAGSLEFRSDTGDFRGENLRGKEARLESKTGAVQLSAAEVSGALTVAEHTGRVRLTEVSCGSGKLTTTTGSVTLERVTASGELAVETDTGNVKLIGGDAGTLRVKTNTGDLTFDGADAGAIYAETDTGDVTGSLRSEKVFLTETDTGKVSVPRTITGGRCEITTNTGDIKISAP